MRTIKLSFMLTKNLGDAIYTIVPFFSFKNIKIQLFLRENCIFCADLYVLLKKHCEIFFYKDYEEMVEKHPDCVETQTAVKTIGKHQHMSKSILEYFDLDKTKNIPNLPVSKNEKEWASNFLSGFENPIAIVPENQGSGDPKNFGALYKKPPIEIFEQIIKNNSGLTFLQFGVSRNYYRKDYDNFEPLNGAIKFLDLPLDKLAALFSQIGHIISGDTGSYHLMVAVGGKCSVFIPDSYEGVYQYSYILYDEKDWGENKRVEYINFHEILRNMGVNK